MLKCFGTDSVGCSVIQNDTDASTTFEQSSKVKHSMILFIKASQVEHMIFDSSKCWSEIENKHVGLIQCSS